MEKQDKVFWAPTVQGSRSLQIFDILETARRLRILEPLLYSLVTQIKLLLTLRNLIEWWHVLKITELFVKT